MTVQDEVAAWLRTAELERPEIEKYRLSSATRTRGRGSRVGAHSLCQMIVDTVLCTPAASHATLGWLVPLCDDIIDEQEAEVRKYQRVTPVAVTALVLANTLDVVGLPLPSNSWPTMRAWLPRMEVSRDDESTADWWTAGFAAVALDEPLRFFKAAGLSLGRPNPFVAGATFQFNMQGLVRHLAAAIETGASFEDVRPAWEDLLHSYSYLRSARSIDEGVLLWIGRIVFHRIAGRPLGEVAQAIHDSAWRLAGRDPDDLSVPPLPPRA